MTDIFNEGQAKIMGNVCEENLVTNSSAMFNVLCLCKIICNKNEVLSKIFKDNFIESGLVRVSKG